jgi:hypothetical protein
MWIIRELFKKNKRYWELCVFIWRIYIGIFKYNFKLVFNRKSIRIVNSFRKIVFKILYRKVKEWKLKRIIKFYVDLSNSYLYKISVIVSLTIKF